MPLSFIAPKKKRKARWDIGSGTLMIEAHQVDPDGLHQNL
jgi:hypothetical protein